MSLPSEQKLNAVSERMIFLKACRIALAEEQEGQTGKQGQQRVQSEVARSLIAQAASLVPKQQRQAQVDNSSTLYVQLGLDIQRAVEQLQGLLDEAAALVESLGGDALTRAGADVSLLSQLRALRVITTEEELLEFVQVWNRFKKIYIFW